MGLLRSGSFRNDPSIVPLFERNVPLSSVLDSMKLRRVTYPVIGLCLLALGGCGRQEPIEEYTVPKQSVVDELTGAHWPIRRTRRPMMRSTSTTTFMLVAVVPHKTKVWYFKLAMDINSLPPIVSQRSASETMQFLKSLEFPESDDEPPKWSIPSHWRQRAGPGQRYATIVTGAEPGSPEITVTTLPMPAGDFASYLEDNVDRWRGMMQGRPDQVTVDRRSLPVGGATATLVTLLSAALVEQDASKGPSDAAAAPTLTYDTPEGWKPGRMNRFRKAAFVVEDGEEQVETTVIPLRISSLLDNVNRWRREVGLKDIQTEQLPKHTQQFTVDSIEGHYVQCVGATRTVLGVLVEYGGQIWFITLKGDNALAKREQKHFEEFAGSIKFKKPDGAGDGK